MKRQVYSPPAIFLSLLLLVPFTAKPQTNVPEGIFQSEVYKNVIVREDILYGGNINHFTNAFEDLYADIYEPDAPIDYRRPLLIFLHGGAFVTGSKTADEAVSFGNYFASRGYVVASVDYRLAKPNQGNVSDNYESVNQANQDARAAIRFFKRFADDYCLDTSAFFITGTSAGASTALLAAYWDQEEADPYVNESLFGPLDSGSGHGGYSNQINALISCWGGISDTSWIAGESTPNQIFHGTDDPVIPFSSGFNGEGLEHYGGLSIYQASLDCGIESYLHPFYDVGHGLSTTSREFDTLLLTTNSFMYQHLPQGIGSISCKYIPDPDFELNVYPNPSNGHVFLDNRTHGNNHLTAIRLFTSTGQLVYSSMLMLSPMTHNELDFSFLGDGIYLLQLLTPVETKTIKVMIEKE